MARGLGKAGKAYRFARDELRATLDARRREGLRRALAQRGRANLELDGLPQVVAELQDAVAAARAAAAEASARTDGAVGAAAELERRIAALRAEADDLRTLLAGTAWAPFTPPSQTLVSVVMPTRDRADLLPASIGSVLAQSHERLELVVVDDGSRDDTAAVVEAVGDARVRLVRREREDTGGPNRAVNAGLRAARGELVAYLDDDNAMQPYWLASVAAAFDAYPDVDVVYGARVFDPLDGQLPALQWVPWDPRTLEDYNLMDQNVIAHRAGLPEAVLDEGLPHAGDWDLALRLTAGKPPLRLPVVAAAYRSHLDGRQSDDPAARRSYTLVQRKLLARRPLRVLGVGVPDELQALEQDGAEVAHAGFSDVEQAIAEVRPDVLVVHAASVAVDHLERLERIGLPFAVLELAAELGGHPLCAGVGAAGVEQLRDGVAHVRCARFGWLESPAPALSAG